MEESPMQGKVMSHSAHANGMNEWMIWYEHLNPT
jgi:hypothetical protein